MLGIYHWVIPLGWPRGCSWDWRAQYCCTTDGEDIWPPWQRTDRKTPWSYRCHPTQDRLHGSGNKAVCQAWHAPAGHSNTCNAKKELWKANPCVLSYPSASPVGLSTDLISSKVTEQPLRLCRLNTLGQKTLLYFYETCCVKQWRDVGPSPIWSMLWSPPSPAPGSISLGSAGRVVNRSRSGCASYSIFAPKEVRCLGNQKGPFSSWKRSISTLLTRLYPVKFSDSAHTLHKVMLAFQKPI